MTALLEVTTLLEYLDLLQFSFQIKASMFFTEGVTSVASMVATPLHTYHQRGL